MWISSSLKDIGYWGFFSAGQYQRASHIRLESSTIVRFSPAVGMLIETVNLKDVLYTRSDDGVDYGDVASLTNDDILRKIFPTKEYAYDFYQKLGRFHGFRSRKGDIEGLRHRKHYNRVDRRRPQKLETRTNCEARMCIYLDRSNNIWRVKKVITKHNHALTNHGTVHLISYFWSTTEAAKAQINGMQGCEILTSKTIQYLAGMAGGFSLVGFLKKNAYNYVDSKRHARIVDGDANSAIVYMEEKFCAGFRTTLRCEDINSVVKKFLQSKHTMLELVQNLELLLREFRNNELLSQFRSIYGDPVSMTTLDSLEGFAARVYTQTIFNDVKKEIEAVASVNFIGGGGSAVTYHQSVHSRRIRAPRPAYCDLM
ncbi:hypothetical protein Ahy_B03g066770 [Arachis hypogaea]|uniref:FAR1 domain-containing protein n=1 Tax=Arachis hypogaea TaxID=3818 RepID=A0A445A4U7_ARAHY|nr:hypothetical protein Ahy_B03g066770 [Arachis hypogaea]